MKVSTTFVKKVPVPGLDYASQGFHLTLEAEPPPEVQEDREKLRRYVHALFKECRDRVEQELEQHRGASLERSQERRPLAPRRSPATRHRRARHHANGRNGSNGHATNGKASVKQINFVRALGAQAGMTYEELADFAGELVGQTDIRELTKREASTLIEELRG